ncbi:MAG: Gfo/Idh/MocA family oxidoreductase, partial [Planctomycetes bacterium]|nr:Gfo/Idh/MocA family oxidoreductase [Planctomycetota bacterium]
MSKSRILLSRRGFVTGAAASLAVPTLIPRHVLGDENNAPANDKIVLGAVGIGKMMYGSHLPHFLKMPEVKIVAVCDVDTTRRETGKKRVDDAYGNTDCAMLTNHNDLVARDDVDAVVCATPDHWHAIVILDACKAGKDIYCEKPLTNNLVEAKAVMDAVNASEIIF